MMTVEEIYHTIGQSIVDSLDENWTKARLHVRYSGKSAGFHLNYWESEMMHNSEYTALDYSVYKAVSELHQITTEGDHNRWNRLEFNLSEDGDMDLQFIWDKELNDQIQRFSEEE